jgi:hypothetical protein
MKKILLTLLLVVTPFIFSTVQAQEGHQQVIDRVFGSGGEVYFKFKVTDKSEADILTRTISIDNVKGHEVYAYANKKEFAAFLDLGYDYTVLQHPGTLLDESELRMGQAGDGPMTIWDFYPTYQQYLDFMAAFAADYPEICRIDTIGYSLQDRLLLAVKISDNVNEMDPWRRDHRVRADDAPDRLPA